MLDIAALDIDALERLRDEVNRRILSMRQTKGLSLPDLLRLLEEVKVTLSDQGKEWYSLERWQYMDGQIRFWLNPKDHENYTPGWYSIDELIAWSHENGPVINRGFDEDEEDEEDEDDGVRWITANAERDESASLRLQRLHS